MRCSQGEETPKDGAKPSATDVVKEFVVDQIRAGARRPVDAADAMQKFQQEQPEVLSALFAVGCLISAFLLVSDLMKALN